MATNMNARKHLSKAVMRVMRTSPFYTTIILKHQMVEDEKVNGMEIDGEEIRYNAQGILTQTPEELGEYLKHMAMHIAFKHHVRAAELKPKVERQLAECGIKFDQVFNQSADLSINSLLRKENPRIWSSDAFKDAPMPGAGKFEDFEDGESTEKYFPKVLKLIEEEDGQKQRSPNQGGEGTGQGPGGGSGGGQGDDEGEDEKPQDEPNQSQNEQEKPDEQPQPMNFGMVKAPKGQSAAQTDNKADEIIAEAIMAAREAGEGTGSVQSIIAENEKPVKIDWRAEASMFFETACRGRKNYRHLNRRLWGGRIVFPTNKDKAAKKVIFLVDVSGSMNDECVGAVYNHIEEVIKAKPSLVVELVPFDDGIFHDHIREFTRDNLPIENSARNRMGYGGTRFCDAAKYAEDKGHDEDVSGVVMLTDRMPIDSKEFEALKPALPWLILSVYKHQFGKSNYGCSTPAWAKIIEIEP